MRAKRGIRVMALLILKLSSNWGLVVSATPWLLYPHNSVVVLILQEGGWEPGMIWMGVEKGKSCTPTSVPTRIK
jgi:hypothetical protein